MDVPWIGIQEWDKPLFLHWPVPYEVLRPLVPEPFVLDTFDGQAWVGIVPFKAVHTKPRWGSDLVTLGSHFQLNFRTYIRFLRGASCSISQRLYQQQAGCTGGEDDVPSVSSRSV
ncbi:uncharacterized protein JNUCC1_00798 [Lentibacillus sp. JNUCC-1]|nr:uncharacterized protein [Lentibacillus sp. JNUCC-1]